MEGGDVLASPGALCEEPRSGGASRSALSVPCLAGESGDVGEPGDEAGDEGASIGGKVCEALWPRVAFFLCFCR